MRTIKYVYLAGPITGVSETDLTPWRSYVTQHLAKDVAALSPTRDVTDSTEDFPLTMEKLRHGKAVVSRDRFDVGRSDLVFANVLGAKRVSIGTVGEIFWADAFRKPVILIIDPEEASNPHFHLMLLELASWVFSNLDEGVAKLNLLLSDCSDA